MNIKSFLIRHSSNPFAMDLRSMALARVAFASIILYDCLFTVMPDVRFFLSDEGFMARDLANIYLFTNRTFSLNMLSGEVWFQYLLLGLQIFFALLLLVGFKTRMATVLTWLLLASQYGRSEILLSNAELLSRTLLFWAIFIPWGACWSIDSAMASQDTPASENKSKPLPTWFFSVGTMLFIAQGYAMYFMSGSLKNGKAWIEGFAVKQALNFEALTTAPGILLRNYLFESPNLNLVLTYSVLAAEFCLPIVLVLCLPFNRQFRLLAAASFALMHLSISLFMNVGLFTAFSIAFWLAVLPPEFWSYFKRKSKPELIAGTTIFYDEKCGFCRKLVRLIRTFLCLDSVPLLHAQKDKSANQTMERENSWVVLDKNGTQHIRYDGLLHLFAITPLPLGPIRLLLSSASVQKIGTSAYKWVASRRGKISFLTTGLRYRPLPVKFYTSRLLNIILIPFFLFLLDINIRTHSHFFIYKEYYPHSFYSKVDRVADALLLKQKWAMFAPFPSTGVHWISFKAILEDGSEVDVMRNFEPFTEKKPEHISTMYPSSRWFKIYENMRLGNDGARSSFIRYYCRELNMQPYLAKQPVKRLELRTNDFNYPIDKVTVRELHAENCKVS